MPASKHIVNPILTFPVQHQLTPETFASLQIILKDQKCSNPIQNAITLVKNVFTNNRWVAEDAKLDYIEQLCRIIKEVAVQPTHKQQHQQRQSHHLTQQKHELIRKLIEFIVQKCLPIPLTQSKMTRIVLGIIDQFIHICPDENSQSNQSQQDHTKKLSKTKLKPQSSQLKTPQLLKLSLLNGTKLDIHWYILFRITQHQLQIKQSYPSLQTDHNQINHTLQQINIILQSVLKVSSKSLTLSLFKTVAANCWEYQLPVVVLYAHTIVEIITKEFKVKYATLYRIVNNEKMGLQQQNLNKLKQELFHTDYLTALIGIANTRCEVNIIWEQIEMKKIVEKKEIVESGNQFCEVIKPQVAIKGKENKNNCSYCGLETKDRFQQISINTVKTQPEKLFICLTCQMQLCGPTNPKKPNIKTILLGPLIMSLYSRNSFEMNQLSHTKQALRKLLITHIEIPELNTTITPNLSDQIVINNNQNTLPLTLITKIYHYFLQKHHKFSLTTLLLNLTQFLLVLSNNTNQSIRYKSLQLLSHPPLLQHIYLHDPNNNRKIDLKDKLHKCATNRLFDVSNKVRIASIELICSWMNYDSLIRKIERLEELMVSIDYQTNDCEFVQKSVQIIGKCIVEEKNGKEIEEDMLVEQMVFMLRAIIMFIELINRSEKYSQTQKHKKQKQSVQITMKSLFKKMHGYCYLHETNTPQFRDKFLISLDKRNENILIIPNNIQQSLYDKIVEIIIVSVRLTPNTILTIHGLRQNMLKKVLGLLCETSSLQQPSKQTLVHNLISIIDVVYLECQQIDHNLHHNLHQPQHQHSQPSKQKQKQFKKQFSNQIINYLTSNQFIQQLFQTNPNNLQPSTNLLSLSTQITFQQTTLLSSIINRQLIIRLLNKNPLVYNYYRTIEYLHSQSSQLILSKPIQNLFNDFLQYLQEHIKVCQLDKLSLLSKLMLQLWLFLGKQQNVEHQIKRYSLVSQHFLNELSQSSSSKQYLLRALTHLTILIINYQTIQKRAWHLFNLNKSLKHNYFNDQLIQHQTTMQQPSDFNTTILQYPPTSFIVRAYDLTMKSLTQAKQLQQFQLIKSILQLLAQYWQIIPQLLLVSGDAIQQLTTLYTNHQIIKTILNVLSILMHTQTTRILAKLQTIFTKLLPKIFQPENSPSNSLIHLTMTVMRHLLRTGMLGIYQLNRYIFYGLIFGSTASQQATQIVKDICHVGSATLLLVNIKQTLIFVLQSVMITAHTNIYIHSRFKLPKTVTWNILFKLTHSEHRRQLLPKQRKQIRTKSTFIKKMGQIITSTTNIMKKQYPLIYFMMKLLQGNKQMDCYELIELLHSLEIIVKDNLLDLEGEKDKEEQHSDDRVVIDRIIVMREVLRTMWILTGGIVVKKRIGELEKRIDNGLVDIYVCIGQKIFSTQLPALEGQAMRAILLKQINEQIDELLIKLLEYERTNKQKGQQQQNSFDQHISNNQYFEKSDLDSTHLIGAQSHQSTKPTKPKPKPTKPKVSCKGFSKSLAKPPTAKQQLEFSNIASRLRNKKSPKHIFHNQL